MVTSHQEYAPPEEYAPPDLGLDFANSGSGPELDRRDPLGSAADFTAWWGAEVRAMATAPLPFPDALPDRRTLLIEARTLRAAIRVALTAVATRSTLQPEALFALNRAIGFARRTDRLTVHGPVGLLRFEHPVDPTHPMAPLTLIARDAADFLTTVEAARLRECAAAGCGTWFVDTSKGGRRRWCSMSLCGNRSKAARYRTRQAPTG